MERTRSLGAVEGITLSEKVFLHSTFETTLDFDEFSKIISEPNYARQITPEFIDLGVSEAYKVFSETEDVALLKDKWEREIGTKTQQEFGIQTPFYCNYPTLETFTSDIFMSTYLLKQKKEKLPCALIGLVRGLQFPTKCYVTGRMLWDVKTLICSRLFYLYVVYNPEIFAFLEVVSRKPKRVYNLVFSQLNQVLEQSPESLRQAFQELAPKDRLQKVTNDAGFPEEVQTGEFYFSTWAYKDFSVKFPTFQEIVERVSSLWV